jgi:hypothetical protein
MSDWGYKLGVSAAFALIVLLVLWLGLGGGCERILNAM